MISSRKREEQKGEEAGEAMDALHSTHLVAVDALVRIVCALKIPSAVITGDRHIRRINGPTINIEGIFSPVLQVGSKLEIGSVIGHIYDIHGSQRESVLSPYDGFLIALTDHAFIKSGNSCCTIAVFET